jgi:hypothetical protein
MNEFLLIVDFENGYLPLGIVTGAEAIEAAKADMDRRTPDDLCPECYSLWKRNAAGQCERHSKFEVGHYY